MLKKINAICYLILSIWTLIIIYPLIQLVICAFTGKLTIVPDILSFSLKNFLDVIDHIGYSYVNSLITATAAVLINLPICTLAGYAFSRFKFRGKMPVFYSLMITQSMPIIGGIIALFAFFKGMGLTNTLIPLIVLGAATMLPLNVWLTTNYFNSIPRELEDAALIDGCTPLQIYLKIILPLSTPVVIVTSIFTFFITWNEFILAVIFLTKKSVLTYPVALMSVGAATYAGGRGTYHWGFLSAGALLGFLPVIIVYLLCKKYLIAGLTSGGVKGIA